MMLPCGYYVADAGIDEPDDALPLLAALSPRFSSDGPIRPFIERRPVVTYRYLHEWVQHPDEHVRRLVSEGSRPRLPWAPQLKELIDDPRPAIELLDRLYDDRSEYVRRSVANHLNGISKNHPDLAIECADRWSKGSTHDDYIVRHGLRTLVKRGHPSALALLGFDYDNDVELVGIDCEPSSIAIGEEITFTAILAAPTATKAAIDYVVHYQGVNGVKVGKVFKLTTRTIRPKEPTQLVRRHRFEHVSIRRIHPGPHRIEIQVNGRVLGGVTVEVTDPDA
jgi:3-methyladenine DNA glycosylase AlkC